MYSLQNDIEVPKRQTKASAGYDFYMPYDLDMEPGVWYTIGTKICLDGKETVYTSVTYPDDKTNRPLYADKWVMLLFPRSSLGNTYGFELANTVGVIDQDFIDHQITARIRVSKPLSLKKGDRFMQGVITPVGYLYGENAPNAERNGGTGSTGINEKKGTDKADEEYSKNLSLITAMMAMVPSMLNTDGEQTQKAQEVIQQTIKAMDESGMLEYIDATVRRQQKNI